MTNDVFALNCCMIGIPSSNMARARNDDEFDFVRRRATRPECAVRPAMRSSASGPAMRSSASGPANWQHQRDNRTTAVSHHRDNTANAGARWRDGMTTAGAHQHDNTMNAGVRWRDDVATAGERRRSFDDRSRRRRETTCEVNVLYESRRVDRPTEERDAACRGRPFRSQWTDTPEHCVAV